jgi:hypothetical protein
MSGSERVPETHMRRGRAGGASRRERRLGFAQHRDGAGSVAPSECQLAFQLVQEDFGSGRPGSDSSPVLPGDFFRLFSTSHPLEDQRLLREPGPFR